MRHKTESLLAGLTMETALVSVSMDKSGHGPDQKSRPACFFPASCGGGAVAARRLEPHVLADDLEIDDVNKRAIAAEHSPAFLARLDPVAVVDLGVFHC